MNKTYTVFLFLITFYINAQALSKKQIKNTEWFTDNKDSIFYKRDTIKLIKYSQKSQQQFSKLQIQYDESEYDYLGHLEYITIGFEKGKNLNFIQKNWSQAMSYAKGVLFWKYDENNTIISIYEDKELKYRFKILNLREIKLVSKKNKNETIKSTELTMLKVK